MRHPSPAAWVAVVGLVPMLVGVSCSPSRDDGPAAVVSPGAPAAAPGSAVAGAGAAVAPSDQAAVRVAPGVAQALADAKVVVSPGGVVVPVLDFGDHGWRVSTPCGREAIIPSARPLRQAAVVLDPGHGGWDSGAVGYNGLTEADLNLAVARHAKAALERAGFSVVLTRDANHGMNLANRAKLAVGLEAKAFVSVHHNGGSVATSDTPGSEAYYQMLSEDSKRLAGLVYEETVSTLRPYASRWVNAGVGVSYRTRQRDGDDYFAMVRLTKGVPSTLAEMAFLSNPPEADLLARTDVQRAEGEALAKGVIRFLTTTDPGSGFLPGGQMAPRPRPPGGGDDACDDPPL